MPLFGGNNRPALDGLTKEEQKRRDALNPEVLRRAGEGGVAGQGPAALAVLREKAEAEPEDYLWALLLGAQFMSMQRYALAIDAFTDAGRRDVAEVRAFYGAGAAYFQAAEAKQAHGAATTDEVAPAALTVDNLYHEALRSFRKALDLTNDKKERDTLGNAIGAVEKALAKKAGRL
jgi:tetratricopeptide (TPR) repeat protein